MINFKDGPRELLQFIFYYGAGVFTPGMFYEDKKTYDAVVKYVKRNPNYFKKHILKNEISFYSLTEKCIEDKIGLINSLLFPRPTDYLDIFQALLYLSMCIDFPEFRKVVFADFQKGKSQNIILDDLNLTTINKNARSVITISERKLVWNSLNIKVITPKIAEFRSVNNLLTALSNFHCSGIGPNKGLVKEASKISDAIKNDVDEYFDQIFKDKKDRIGN